MLLAKGWEHVKDVLLVKIIMPQEKCMLYASSHVQTQETAHVNIHSAVLTYAYFQR